MAYVTPTPRPKMGAPEAGYEEAVRHVSHVSGGQMKRSVQSEPGDHEAEV